MEIITYHVYLKEPLGLFRNKIVKVEAENLNERPDWICFYIGTLEIARFYKRELTGWALIDVKSKELD